MRRARRRLRAPVAAEAARETPAIAGRLENVKDGPLAPVVRVQLDALPVCVWALHDLDGRIDGKAVAPEQDLHGINVRADRVRPQRAALHGRGGLEALDRRLLHPVFARFRSSVKISEDLNGGFSPNLAQLIQHGP